MTFDPSTFLSGGSKVICGIIACTDGREPGDEASTCMAITCVVTKRRGPAGVMIRHDSTPFPAKISPSAISNEVPDTEY